jgi:hypothetical protein
MANQRSAPRWSARFGPLPLFGQIADKMSVSPNLFGGVLRMKTARRRAFGSYCPEDASNDTRSGSAVGLARFVSHVRDRLQPCPGWNHCVDDQIGAQLSTHLGGFIAVR